jgi:extracellular factor (EF) 3-hydroxypalmitic acid methyl ester biosynthesis protein
MLSPGAETFLSQSGEINGDEVSGGASRVSSALARLTITCDEFVKFADVRMPAVRRLHATAAGLHAFAAAIDLCEEAGIEKATLQSHIAPMRALHARSPFVHRLQAWPRGYAGDFETIEYLCDAENRAPFGSIAWAIEQYALQSPIAQQHRNKVGLQARAILSTLLATRGARIASIGCGGCRDLALVQHHIPPDAGTFVLIDSDADALAFARQRLDRLRDRCEFVRGRVPRVLTASAVRPSNGLFDLVVAGGLFDYLQDDWAIATLRLVRRMLVPGGRLILSNIAAGNPFRAWLEYLGSWSLIERQPEDLARLLTAAEFQADGVHITRDSTGLALMADVRVE